MWRRRDRWVRRSRRHPPGSPDGRPVVAGEGDMVIDGHVRARLLGVSLLDLDAHVIVAPAGTRRARAAPAAPGPPPRARPQRGSAGDGRTAPRLRPRAGRPDTAPSPSPSPLPGLARAEHLLAEGAQLLDEAGRIH